MHEFDFSHVSDEVLVRNLTLHTREESEKSATVIAEIAEVDTRKLYVPAGFPSMYAYCLGVLRLSEDAAYKRIQAARAGRQFPVLFRELSTSRLHLAAVCLLAPHLTPENADQLVAAAVNRTKAEIEEYIARQFPDSRERSSSHSTIRPLAVTRPSAGSGEGDLLGGLIPADTQNEMAEEGRLSPGASADAPRAQLAPGQVGEDGSAVTSLALPSGASCRSEVVERFEVRVTIDRHAYERLRHLQTLMSHAIPDGDLAQVLGRAVETTIAVIERRKIGAPRSSRNESKERKTAKLAKSGRTIQPKTAKRGRYIPAPIRREVWNRDGGQCTFVGTGGHRCQARHLLQFDHIEPVARGGGSSAQNLRLRCRAHNQYEAERSFGSAFMKTKRGEAESEKRAAVMAALRNLGCRSDEARRAAEYAESLPGRTLEEHIRSALSYLRPRAVREGPGPYTMTWDSCDGSSPDIMACAGCDDRAPYITTCPGAS